MDLAVVPLLSSVARRAMKILFLTSGRRAPATRFRVLPYVPHLRRAGHRCVVRHSHPAQYEHYPWLGWRLSFRLRRWLRSWNLCEARLRRFDLVYIERELFDDDSPEFELRFRRLVRSMVLDVDDGVFLRHPAKYAALAGTADAVIAGNDSLAEYTRPLNSRVTVIPTSVDLERYRAIAHPAGPGQPVIIGWTGTSSNLHHLRIVEEPMRRLAARHSIEFHVIADDPGPMRGIDFGALPVRFFRWSPRIEVARLQGCHLGIMPLADAPWERYKCGLKLIQYMALGIPAAASPVGVNAQIVRSGENGFLAASSEQWFERLDALIRDPALRERIGMAGRRTVESTYSVQANASRLLETLAAAHQPPR